MNLVLACAVYVLILCWKDGNSLSQRKEEVYEVACEERHFMCHDGSGCIPHRWHCDFSPDCPDASDEPPDCPPPSCHGSFACKVSRRCIPHGWVCDGAADCGFQDDSDEHVGVCPPVHACPPNHFLCGDGVTCRQTVLLCDNTTHCPDGSDEGDFCDKKTGCEKQNCTYGCKQSQDGGVCFCRDGKRPLEGQCVDFNKCDWEEYCDQLCFYMDNIYKCICEEGYELRDSTRCIAINDPEDDPLRIIYASAVHLEELYANGSSVPGDTSVAIKHLLAFDFDHRNRTVCWVSTDFNESQLSCAPVDHLSHSWTIDHNPYFGLNYVQDIALDWVTGNWYILDLREVIFMCNATFEICVTLFDAILNRPKGLALDPSTGFMFFTDWGTQTPKLERALMDGSMRETIVSTKIVYPFGVTVDYVNRHVYWVDSYLSNVERVDYDGRNRRTISRLKDDERPFGITVFENSVFVTNWGDHSIKRMNRFQFKKPEEIVLVKVTNTEPLFIHIFHRQRQPEVTHPCGVNNGGCMHFCFPLWNDDVPAPKCKCQPGFTLKESGACVGHGDTSFLIYVKGSPGMIKGVPLDVSNSSEIMMPITSLARPMALDFDSKTGFIYYTDIQRYVIERQKVDGSSRELVTKGLYNVEGVAVDWMGRNLYWTDEGVSYIFVCSLRDPEKRRILVSRDLDNVRAIALEPKQGIMFWSIWEFRSHSFGKTGLIETAWMDGSHRQPFVQENLYWPNGLTIDYKNMQLYWCDGFYLRIERINLDGTGREALIVGKPLVHPYGLSYFDGFIYWSEFQNGTIVRASVEDASNIQVLQGDNQKVFDVKVYSKERQKGTNGCEDLDCEDLCLNTPEGPVCECRMEFEPDINNVTSCVPMLNFTYPKICSETQFLCNKSLYCIEQKYVCDGEDDCHDMSDEDSSPGGVCEQVGCPENMFKCENNLCISSLWVCDGDIDCVEGSDELEENCQCNPGQFHCDTGRCIPNSWVCDIEEDCGPGDKSDEHENCEYEKCDVDDFTCAEKSCIPIFFVCDKENDCENGTDEMFCQDFCENATKAGHNTSPYCNQNCQNITNATLCQELETCHLCSEDEDTIACIPLVQVCDKHADCPRGSDEASCPETAAFQCNEFLCSSQELFRECIPKHLRCDGDYDCFDHSDEEGCDEIKCSEDMWKCPDSGECIHGFFRCDQDFDCEDESDEENCPPVNVPCPSPNIRCDNGTKCVPPDNICDSNSDCDDGADEGPRCGANDCELINCEGICMQGSEGPYCTCLEGQTLLEDGTSCSETHRCEVWGICSQICVPLKYSYNCSCYEGYQLEFDQYSCKSTDPAVPYLLFSNRQELRRLPLKPDSNFQKSLISSLKNTIAVDFYHAPEGDYIFWTDVVDDKIYKGQIIFGVLANIEVIVKTGLSTAEGLAVDWTGQNLYWVESNLAQIEVAKLNGSFRRTLISDQMDNPRAIALDPRVGMLFWSDWEHQNARIESSSMAGEGRRVVVLVNDIRNGGWPNGITLDFVLKRIYWTDAKSDSIHSAFYDGSDHREILRSHHLLSHVFAITLFGTNIYWTDWRTNSVTGANKFNGSNVEIIHQTVTQPFDVKVLHPSRQPKASFNPCEKDNGGCSHLCLLSFNSTRQCNCPQIMSLHSDNVTCIRKEKVLIFSRPNEIRGVDISKPSSDIMTKIPIAKTQTTLPIDFVENNTMIYWADVRMNEIKRVNISASGSVKETIVDTGIESPTGFAIDWLSRNMFIASSGPTRKQISVGTINGYFLMPIITTGIHKIESLAVDPYEGRVFWSDVGDIFHNIQVASMLGTQRRVLTSQKDNAELKYPTSLTYDPQSQRLYWSNRGSKTIQFHDFKKNEILNLLTGGNTSEPVAVTVYKEFVYFFDGSDGNIYRMDKYTGSGRETIQTSIQGILALKVYDKGLRMDSSNACSQEHQRCDHLCLPINATERKCHCAVGYRVDDKDPNVCVGENDVLIYSTNMGLSGLSVAVVQTDIKESATKLEDAVTSSNSMNFLPPISQVGTASRLDFHSEKDLLLWVDKTAGTITRIQRDGTDRKILLNDEGSIDGLAVDWAADNLYWTNPSAKVIELCRLNGAERYVLIADGLNKPGALVVHPSLGFLFWIDNGKNPKIVKSTLDGKNRTVLANSSLHQPIDLSIDYQNNILYFIDGESRTLERMALDGSSRSVVLKHELKPVSLFVFEQFVYLALNDGSGGSLNVIDTKTNKTVWHRAVERPLNSIIIMSSNAQLGGNPCSVNNGGCQDLCLFNGTRANCHCFHGKIGEDGKKCDDYEAFLMYSNNSVIRSLHMFEDQNPNLPLKSITSDLMKNAISLAFDYANRRLYYSDIRQRSINSVFFNGSDHKILVEGQGSVEGVAFEEKQKDLYWTCQNNASINRMSVLPKQGHVEKIVKLAPYDKPRGIAVDGCGLRIYWTNWNSKAPSIQRSYLNGVNPESIITSRIRMPNGLVIDHKAQKIYWGDARLDKIERCDMDGTRRVVLIREFPSHPFDLAIYGDYLFWSDWGLQAVIRVNKYTGKEAKILTPKIPNIMGIIAVANDTNACDSTLCDLMNGGCEDFCRLDERGQVICSCSSGRTLLPDGRRCASNLSNCSESEFPCGSGFCIPYSFSCDGVSECPDNSDEDPNYCAKRECRKGYFHCGHGLCVPNSNVCDGFGNCPDFSDENDCPCKDDEFRCTQSGLCISGDLRCNLEPDCPDATDEMGCGETNCSDLLKHVYRGVELIACANTTNCIHPKWICDGYNDCWDNSDEQNCNATSKSNGCKGFRFECDEGVCSPKLFFCDEEDKADESGNSTAVIGEEFKCPEGQFKCASDSKCIYDHWLCDRMIDCLDGSDEPKNCKNLSCSSDEFKCSETGRCIPVTWVCDGDKDCGSVADDENPVGGCPETAVGAHTGDVCEEGHFMCKMFHHEAFECLPMALYCDGVKDCPDGSDEPEACRSKECLSSQFTCDNKVCISLVWLCNGRDECGDGSDENNCTANRSVSAMRTHECGGAQFRCSNSICVGLEKLCDGQNDCGDYSDERQCNVNECLQTNHSVCAHKCVDKLIGYSCECHEGFEINANDSRLCQDIDECDTEFPCAQQCTNTYGSYRCSCTEGYVSEDDGHTCTVNSTLKPHLIVSIRYFIREIGLEDKFNRVIINNLTNVVALDYEWESKCFFWSDVTHLSSSIMSICQDGVSKVLHTTVQGPDGIAVDWVGKNLYWCDKGKDTIEVSKIDGKHRKVLIQEGLEDPRAIVLDPFHGYMYWTDWGNHPHIGKAGMDGSDQRILINSTVGWPNALTISYATNEIFWADAQYDYISRCDLDGKNRKVILSKETAPNYVQHIFAISVFEDWLYWTDWELKSVVRANKYTGKNINKVYSAIYRPMDLHVYHPYRQLPLKNNPCENGGGCDTMCLLAPGGNKTCACPQNYVLEPDNKSCVSNCSFSQFVCNSTYKCIPFFWKCDTQDDCGDGSDEPDDCPAFNCTLGEFQCANGNCIHPSQICDTKDQCNDGSDEKNCDKYACMPSQFKCPAMNGTTAFCIPKKQHCDGTVDCPGGEDELNCAPSTCRSDWFRCNNNRCIPLVWVCDEDRDCPDDSDEQANCLSRQCRENEFRCKNGRCIPNGWMCDGEYDCPDKEDENECFHTHFCSSLYFKCENNRCIPSGWQCDGDNDCKDGSDEVHCTSRSCIDSEFTCSDGRCIPEENVCDGFANCDDGSDEIDCPPKNCTDDQFMCVTNNTCILKQWVCDNDADCGDMSDERDCHKTCLPQQSQCASGDCVHNSWLCDGHPDCRDQSDEDSEFCFKHECLPDLFRCNNSVCLPKNKLCNGFNDCGDGSDENNVICQKLCRPHEFECKGGRCISSEWVCDGFDDCTDSSDEEDCPSGCRFGQCSQICNLKKDGSHTCTCEKGYTLHSWSQKNQKSCFADGNLAYMILANDNHLRKLSPYKHGNSAGILTLTEEDAKKVRIESVDVLYGKEPQAFWTNRHELSLVTMSVPTTEDSSSSRSGRTARDVNVGHIRTLVEGLKDPKGVAVDWVTKTVYFVDAGAATISAVSADGKMRATLIGSGLDHPFDIVVDPKSGLVFWTDMGGLIDPRIEVARMNGSYRKVLVEGSMVWPVGLAIDYPARRLYWADTKTQTIETVRLDGSDRNVVKKFSSDQEIPYRIDVFEDLLYVTTFNTNTIYRISKFGGRQHNLVKISQYPLKLSDVVLVQEMKQDTSIHNPCSEKPCGEDAMCLFSGPQSYSCVCPDGSREEKKEEKLKCVPIKSKKEDCSLFCHVGRCNFTAAGMRCICPPMYKGPYCNIYRCSGYCKNGGQCRADPNREKAGGSPELKCFCPPEWTGAQCEIPLSPCKDGFCANGGQCIVNKDTGEMSCECLEPFLGKDCKQCKDLSCENGGICRVKSTSIPSTFCACPPHFYGTHCERSTCKDSCRHGECVQNNRRLVCNCFPGWTGENCDSCMHGSCSDPCSKLKCKNDASCQPLIESPNNAKCICKPGFYGNQCQYSFCKGYCLNGLCELIVGQPTCRCNGGWSGPRCSVSTCEDNNCSPCSSLSCENGGSCFKNTVTHEVFCLCKNGFLGPTCNTSQCENFCENGGDCHLSEEGSPTCACAPGFTGPQCERIDCDPPCVHGICRTTGDGVECVCEPGYIGRRCEEVSSKWSKCLPSPCENGGTCVNLGDKVACKCSLEFEGENCGTPIDSRKNPCASFSCSHGGICQSLNGTASCVCAEGWVGTRCQSRPGCGRNHCFNGGTCLPNPDQSLAPSCICNDGFVGMRCETPTFDESRVARESYEESSYVVTIVVAVLIAVVSVLGLIAALVIWRRKGKGIGHVRLQENGGTVELTNPMYLHPTEPEEDNDPIFTLQDTTNNFKNPVYDIMYDGAANSTHEEKAGLLQSDPLGVLDTAVSSPATQNAPNASRS